MARTIQTKRVLVGTFVLGQNLNAGQSTLVDLTRMQPFINVGSKAMLARLEFKTQITFTIPAAQPALPSLFFKYLLDVNLTGPAKYPIVQDCRGWQAPLWQYLRRGEVDWLRGSDIAAGTTAGTRTFTTMLDFEEPNLAGPIARMYPIEVLSKAPGAELRITLHTAANGLVTIKGVPLTVTAATVTIYAHLFDVAPDQVPIPIPITQYWLNSENGALNPSPGPGQYLRIAMARSPVPGDMIDAAYGAGGGTSDDLSTYTTIDYFGLAGNYSIYQEPVDGMLQRVMRDITIERHSTVNTNSANKSEFRILDPQENFDGLARVLTLVYPSKSSDIVQSPLWNDYPRLGANGGVRTNLPGDFHWLLERIDPRTDALLNATVQALTSVSTQKPVIGRRATPNKGHRGADTSRVPLTINCT